MKRYLDSAAAQVVRRKYGSLTAAALELHVSRAHLSQALSHTPGRGSQVRKKVAAGLTAAELVEARMDAVGRWINHRDTAGTEREGRVGMEN